MKSANYVAQNAAVLAKRGIELTDKNLVICSLRRGRT